MNALLSEIRRSLVELAKGLDGQLNMSEGMEDLASALSRNEVGVEQTLRLSGWQRRSRSPLSSPPPPTPTCPCPASPTNPVGPRAHLLATHCTDALEL
jgi:hypothetical protein